MGTFRGRFSILSTAGSSFSTSGAGDNAFHFYQDATKSGVINFHLIGNCYYLDGSVIPIAFAGLPAGFTPIGNLKLTSPQTILGGGFFNVLQVPADASGYLILNYGIYGPINLFVTGNLLANNIVLNGVNDLTALLTIQCSIVHNALLGNAAEVYDTIDISGSYGIQGLQASIQNVAPVKAGDKITITAPSGLLAVKKINLILNNNPNDPCNTITISLDPQNPGVTFCGVFWSWLEFVFTWTDQLLQFYLPFGLNKLVGPVVVTLDGTTFSGSVVAGVLNVIYADGSGIYVLDKKQTNDILYFRGGYTTNANLAMIPGLSVFTEDPADKDDFYNMLQYPQAIMSSFDDSEEDADLDEFYKDFSIISTLQGVVVTNNVEIPSPFAKTGFLP